MAARTRLFLLAVIFTLCVGCDQVSKSYASTHLKHAPAKSYLADTLRIQYAENRGAFLSLAGDLPRHVRLWLLTYCNGLVLVGVGVYLVSSRNLDRLTFVALALILAGGIGNLIDRVMLDGIVVDFLNLGFADQELFGIPLRTGIFNVADMAITAGFCMLLPKLFQGEPAPPGEPEAATS